MARERAVRLVSFGVVQLFAAVHIFAYHLFMLNGYFPGSNFVPWAATWDSFFFVVSGFNITYSQLLSEDPLDMGPFRSFVGRHLMRLYPLYGLSLLLTGLDKVASSSPWPFWSRLPANALLVFTWVGTGPLGWHSGWHGTNWYISNLAFHWLCWRLVFPRVFRASPRACWCVILATVLLTYIRILAMASRLLVQQHLFFAPYSFPQFLCGMCLARLFVAGAAERGQRPRSAMAPAGPRRCDLGSALTLCSLLCVFRFNPQYLRDRAPGCLLAGVLLPVQVALIWFLAVEEGGPVVWLAKRRPFVWADRLTYGLYILHWNVVTLLGRSEEALFSKSMPHLVRFLVFLLPITVGLVALAERSIDRPLRNWALGKLHRS